MNDQYKDLAKNLCEIKRMYDESLRLMMDNHALTHQDLAIYGVAFERDGKRIPPKEWAAQGAKESKIDQRD